MVKFNSLKAYSALIPLQSYISNAPIVLYTLTQKKVISTQYI